MPKVDPAVQRAAAAISKAITEMIADLPVGASSTVALEQLVEQLASLEAWQLIMEDPDIIDAYHAAVAELATAKPRNQRGR
jgi:hypothetical protein